MMSPISYPMFGVNLIKRSKKKKHNVLSREAMTLRGTKKRVMMSDAGDHEPPTPKSFFFYSSFPIKKVALVRQALWTDNDSTASFWQLHMLVVNNSHPTDKVNK